MNRHPRLRFLLPTALLVAAGAALAADPPLAVSPGGDARFVRLRDGCPTLSWGEVPNARGYEIELTRITDDGRGAEIVLEVHVPARALSWSPDAEQCLSQPGRYAWAVRALTDEGATEWSRARLLEIDAQPSRAEVESALRVLERYLAAGGKLPTAAIDRGPAPRRGGERATAGAKAGATAVAISGDVGGATGTTYGVHGISHSPDGAGVAAENSDPAGADLLLVATEPAKVTESGLSRTSASDVTFDFANPGGGTMKLRVDGIDVVTTATDQNTTYLPGNQLNLNGAAFDVVEGPGSGLDADTLDGLDSTAFLPGGADNWVNTTGDTMTGTLTLDPAAGFALTTGSGKGVNLGGDLFKGGTRFLHTTGTNNTAFGISALPASSTGTDNTAIGFQALQANTTGSLNVVVGASALSSNTTGTGNTATGVSALRSNTTGIYNTASGRSALRNNTTGSYNAATGVQALEQNTSGKYNAAHGAVALWLNTTGSSNTASGYAALARNTGGNENVAVGMSALVHNTTGTGNTALGYGAGFEATAGNNNVFINHRGFTGDAGVIRIGTTGSQNSTFVAGISGVTTAGAALPVVVDASGQLGTAAGAGGGINADTLDGMDSSGFALAAHGHAGGDIVSGLVAEPRIADAIARDAEVMPTVLADDGHGSGLDADTLDGVHGASYQVRVVGVCPAGQPMRGITAEGEVVCDAIIPNPPVVTTVNAPAGGSVSLAIGNDSLPVIAYTDGGTAFDLKVAKCNDLACAGGDETISIVDGPTFVYQNLSLAIGADGYPVISYMNMAAASLMVAKCNDVACAGSNETLSTVDDPATYVGYYSSIAVGADGFPVIAYYEDEYNSLKVAKCNDVACAGGDETINFFWVRGEHPSIAIGNDDFPVISSFGPGGILAVVKCNDVACAGGDETISAVDDPANNVGWGSSLAIGTDGFPVISYIDGTAQAFKVAKCNDAACAGGDETITTIDDPPGSVSYDTSIGIGTDGFPVISYQDPTTYALKVVQCNDPACAGGDETYTTVDNPANAVAAESSLAIGDDGLPVIGYTDSTAYAVKVAKCKNPSCR